jgi:hypothetical protein
VIEQACRLGRMLMMLRTGCIWRTVCMVSTKGGGLAPDEPDPQTAAADVLPWTEYRSV